MSEQVAFWDHPRMQRAFGLDLRSLAAMRIGLAIVLLLDVLNRWGDLRAHYSDVGILSREAARGSYTSWRWSLHALSGSEWLTAALLVLAAVFAFMLLVGLRTRLATAASWFLLLSLHHRNYLIINAGDQLLSLLLLFCMFLPLGARASLDRRRHRPREGQLHLSMAGVAFMLQLFFVYYFTALIKNDVTWREGTALHYALYLDAFATPLGVRVREQAWLLPILCRGSWYLEFAGVWFMFAPVAWLRGAAVLGFVGFHLGTHLTMEIGLFPAVCISAWLAILPGELWDWLSARAHGATARCGAALDALAARLPRGLLAPRPTIVPVWQQGLAATLLAYCALWNLACMATGRYEGLPAPLQVPGYVFGLEQRWNMFAPPLKQDGWYVVAATLSDGSEVDLWRGGRPLTWAKPSLVSRDYRTQRWRKLMLNLRVVGRPHVRDVAGWLRRTWDEAHPQRTVVSLKVWFMMEVTDEQGDTPACKLCYFELGADGRDRVYTYQENMETLEAFRKEGS